MPTLERLPKHIPIIAQAEAADRIRPLGFKSLTTISHGQTMSLCDGSLQLTATAGALVGPPWSTRQNGYVLRVGAVRCMHYMVLMMGCDSGNAVHAEGGGVQCVLGVYHTAVQTVQCCQSLAKVSLAAVLQSQCIWLFVEGVCSVTCLAVVHTQEQGVEAPASLYYEPHCDFDQSSVARVGQVDVVISPVQSVLLGG